jgi:hypothetical protein
MQLSLITLITFLTTAILAAPVPSPQVIGTPCFGSSELGCGLFEDSKRDATPELVAEIIERRAEAIASPAEEKREASSGRVVIGTPCIGSSDTGCRLSKHN